MCVCARACACARTCLRACLFAHASACVCLWGYWFCFVFSPVRMSVSSSLAMPVFRPMSPCLSSFLALMIALLLD